MPMQGSKPTGRLLTVREVADQLGVGYKVASAWMCHGLIPSRHVGKELRTTQLAVDAFVEAFVPHGAAGLDGDDEFRQIHHGELITISPITTTIPFRRTR